MKTLLILRFSSIGDIVLTTSVLRRLKEDYQGVKLVFVTKHSFVGLLPDGVEVIGFTGFNSDFVARLRGVKADAILDLHANLRTRFIKLMLWNIPSFSLNKQRFGRWLFLKTDRHWIPLKHVVYRYHETVEPLLKYWSGEDYAIGKVEQERHDAEVVANLGRRAALWMSSLAVKNLVFAKFGISPKKYGVLHLSATYNTKRIPDFIWEYIIENRTEHLILLGGKEDVDRANRLVASAKISDWSILSVVGETTLQESMKIVEEADWFVGGDTGFTHIATAYQVPVLLVWGNTSPDLGFSPWTGSNSLVYSMQVEELSCNPCSRLGYDSCPKKHFNCMMLQDLRKMDSYLQKMRNND